MKRRRRGQGYITGTREQLLKTAVFLRGLFFTARDLIFMGQGMIPMLDAFFSQVEDGEFLELLPQPSGLWRIYSGRVKEGWKSGGRKLHREKVWKRNAASTSGCVCLWERTGKLCKTIHGGRAG